MWSALERRAALFPLAAAGALVGVSALFSGGSSTGRLASGSTSVALFDAYSST